MVKIGLTPMSLKLPNDGRTHLTLGLEVDMSNDETYLITKCVHGAVTSFYRFELFKHILELICEFEKPQRVDFNSDDAKFEAWDIDMKISIFEMQLQQGQKKLELRNVEPLLSILVDGRQGSDRVTQVLIKLNLMPPRCRVFQLHGLGYTFESKQTGEFITIGSIFLNQPERPMGKWVKGSWKHWTESLRCKQPVK